MTATVCAPTWPVDAPPLRPAVNGLLAYAEQPTGDGTLTVLTPGGAEPAPEPDRWQAGFGFRPLTGSGLVAFVNDYSEGISGNDDDPYKLPSAVGTLPSDVVFQPYNLIGALECTLLSFRDLDGETRALINVALSDAIEHQLWTGSAYNANQSLTDGNATKLAAGAAVPLARAIALLDQAVTAALHGALGMIHVTPYVLARLGDFASGVNLRWQADRWVTPNGHTVVAGSGYNGSAPRTNVGDAATAAVDMTLDPPSDQWAYGTGPVFVRLAPVVRATPAYGTSLNKLNDRQRFIVERVGAAVFSPVAQFAAKIDLTP